MSVHGEPKFTKGQLLCMHQLWACPSQCEGSEGVGCAIHREVYTF
jgi:hypothetical protein